MRIGCFRAVGASCCVGPCFADKTRMILVEPPRCSCCTGGFLRLGMRINLFSTFPPLGLCCACSSAAGICGNDVLGLFYNQLALKNETPLR